MKKNILVKVLPRSSRDQIIKISDFEYRIKLTSAPVDGEANKKLLDILSKEWKIPKTSIHIIKGERSKTKIISVD